MIVAAPIHQQPTGAQQASAGAANVGKMASVMDGLRKSGGVALGLLKEFVGPLALATGAAAGFVGVLVKAVVRSEVLERSLDRISKINYYAPSFAKLLGGMQAAKQRLAEMSKLAAKGPFAFDDLAQGNRQLEILSRGVLAGKRGMNLISDAAAAGGTSFKEMSGVVGSLYDDIANSRPIESGIRQLESLGVISRNTADQLLIMGKAGLSNSEMWKAVEKEISRTKGSSEALAKTIGGLQQKLESARAEQERGIGQMFETGQKSGLEAQIATVEFLTPLLRDMLAPLAGIFNAFQQWKKAIIETLAKNEALVGAIKAVTTTLLGLSAVLLAIGFAQTAKLIFQLSGYLFNLAAQSAGAVTGMSRFGMTMKILQTTLTSTAFWMSAVALGASVIAGAMMDAAGNVSFLKDKQKQLKDQIEETSKALRDQINATKTQADRSTNVSKAQENVIALEKKIAEAKAEAAAQEKASQTQGRKIGEFWNKTLFGEKTGTQQADENVAALEAQRADALKQTQEAMNAPTNAGVESLMGEDYQKEKAASAKKIAEMNAEFERLSTIKAGSAPAQAKTIEDQQAKIASEVAAAAARFSSENLEKKFNIRQASSAASVRSMREIARQTGDPALRDKANAEEDKAYQERRKKELINQGFEGPMAAKMAERDTLLNAAERQREQQGRPQVSSSVAAGLGGSSLAVDVGKQQLDRLKSIEEELKKMNADDGESKWKQPN